MVGLNLYPLLSLDLKIVYLFPTFVLMNITCWLSLPLCPMPSSFCGKTYLCNALFTQNKKIISIELVFIVCCFYFVKHCKDSYLLFLGQKLPRRSGPLLSTTIRWSWPRMLSHLNDPHPSQVHGQEWCRQYKYTKISLIHLLYLDPYIYDTGKNLMIYTCITYSFIF